VLLAVLAVYALGTAGAAAAQNIGELIAARVVQGASLSILPLAFAILREALPPERPHVGTGMVSGVVGAGAGGGLVIGGLLADHFSWRYRFVLGVVLAVVSLVLVLRWVPSGVGTTGGRLDRWGGGLPGLALVALLLALTKGPAWGWTGPRTLRLFAVAAVLAALLVVVERGRDDALVDIAELTDPPMLMTHLSSFAFGALSYVFYVAMPRFAQTPHDAGGYGFGATVTVAALLTLPGAIAVMPASMAVGVASARWGSRSPLVVGFVVAVAGSAALAVAHAAMWQHLASYALVGAGSGLVIAALPKLVGELVPLSRTATANGINNIAGVGVAGASIARSRPWPRGAPAARPRSGRRRRR